VHRWVCLAADPRSKVHLFSHLHCIASAGQYDTLNNKMLLLLIIIIIIILMMMINLYIASMSNDFRGARMLFWFP